jgi:hypothetical protein
VISKRPRPPCFSDRAILPGGGPGERPRCEGVGCTYSIFLQIERIPSTGPVCGRVCAPHAPATSSSSTAIAGCHPRRPNLARPFTNTESSTRVPNRQTPVRSNPTRVAFSVVGARLAARPPQDCWPCNSNSVRLSSAPRAPTRVVAFGPGFWPQRQFDHSTPLIRLPRSLGFRQTSWPDAERRGVELSHGRPHGEDPRVARAGQEVLATHCEVEARSAPFPAESLIE